MVSRRFTSQDILLLDQDVPRSILLEEAPLTTQPEDSRTTSEGNRLEHEW